MNPSHLSILIDYAIEEYLLKNMLGKRAIILKGYKLLNDKINA